MSDKRIPSSRDFAGAFGVLVPCIFLSIPYSAAAHHGTNVSYDVTRKIEVSGVVTKWDFIFPHPVVWFDVTTADGKVARWGTETGSNPAYYLRDQRGINRNTIKPGDKIKLICHPHRSLGATSCLANEVEINGTVLEGLTFRATVLPAPQDGAGL